MIDQARRQLLKLSLASAPVLFRVPKLFGAADAKSPSLRPVHSDIRHASELAKLSLRFRGKTAAEFAAWRTRFRKKLAELLGDCAPPTKWRTVEEQRTELPDHTRIELQLRSTDAPAVPVYLLIPKGVTAKKPAPAVLCVHGHGAYGHHPIVGRTNLPGVAKAIQGANYDYGLQFVRRGYVVAAPCLIPFGRRLDKAKYGKTDPCATTFVRLQALGQTTMGANLRDLRWCLNLLQKLPEVRKDSIGCAGLSYGGRMTMLVSAMDERIKACAVSGALNLLQERIRGRYSCGSQIIPGLLKYGDYSEIASLIVPRPAVWEVGSRDGLVVPKWDKLFKERLHRAYTAAGVADRLTFDHFDGGHRWNGKVAYPLFDWVLKR